MLRWSLPTTQPLVFHTWEDDEHVVVFDPFSGDTHQIDSAGMGLLQLLADAPQSATPALAHALADLFVDGGPEEIAEYIDATLHRLQNVGLVVSASL